MASSVENKEEISESSAASFSLKAESDSDKTDAALSSLRKSKVWNEPNYNRIKEILVPPLQYAQAKEDIQEANNETPLLIHVETGNDFFNDLQKMYPMSSTPRGNVLIINNQEFDNPNLYEFRKGADVDAKNLELLFTQLGFSVTSVKNMRRNEMFKQLIDFADFSTDKAGDMMAVCILSHGLEHGKIVSADGLSIDIEQDVLRY